MENIPPSEESVQKINGQGPLLRTIIFVITGVICAIVIVFVIIKYVTVSQPLSFSIPQQIGVGSSNRKINICTEQHAGYPFLSDILTTKSDPNLGVYQGFIRTFDSAAQSLTIASKPSGHIFIFPIKSSYPILYDYHRAPVTDFSTIQSGTKVFVSFPCQQQSGTFTITKVQMAM